MKSELDHFKVINVLGTGIHAIRMEELIGICRERIESREHLLIGVTNVAKIINCRKDEELRRSLEEPDLIVADGMPIVWLSKMMGTPLPERVAGIDIFYKLLELSSVNNYAVYFFGAKRPVVEKAVEYTKENYPGTPIAGYHDGYFTESQEKEIAQDIKNSSADIVFVAMTPPKKEIFLRRWGRYIGVPVCHGVGGSFDVVAGVTRRAPLWMQKSGLEWLYRLIQEPRRMWKRYLVTNSAFVVLSLAAIARTRFGSLKGLLGRPREEGKAKPKY